ncbi:hypothetical protein [Lysobacter fragariae]
MTLLPDGRSERAVLDGEVAAGKELRRLTDVYLAKVRELYPSLSPATQRRITPAMQQLRDVASTRQKG